MLLYQDATRNWWYLATITSLCAQPRSYNIIIREGVTYRKTQAHLMPYQPLYKKTEDEHSGSNMWTLNTSCNQIR